MATKRKTPTKSTIIRETTSAPMLVKRGEAVTVGEQEIRRLAYEKFIARGGQPGRDLEDWFAAEAELRAI